MKISYKFVAGKPGERRLLEFFAQVNQTSISVGVRYNILKLKTGSTSFKEVDRLRISLRSVVCVVR